VTDSEAMMIYRIEQLIREQNILLARLLEMVLQIRTDVHEARITL
jgi:hypothetical protein